MTTKGVLVAYSTEGEIVYRTILGAQQRTWYIKVIDAKDTNLQKRVLYCNLKVKDLKHISTDQCKTLRKSKRIRCLNAKCNLKDFKAAIVNGTPLEAFIHVIDPSTKVTITERTIIQKSWLSPKNLLLNDPKL